MKDKIASSWRWENGGKKDEGPSTIVLSLEQSWWRTQNGVLRGHKDLQKQLVNEDLLVGSTKWEIKVAQNRVADLK